MNDAFATVASVFVAGLITENLVFERALGINKAVTRSNNYRDIISFGILFCLSVVLGGTFAWAAGIKLSALKCWNDIRGLVVLLCIIAAYFAMVLLIGKNNIKSVHAIPVAVAFNSASFGTVFYALMNYQKFMHVIVYCISCSLGVMFSMMLIHSGKERLLMSKVPRSFQGIPIIMVYIGILGLAFYGLIGHRLPT